MELTKEYFEQHLDQQFAEKLKNLATKDDLKGFATKDDLKTSLAAQSEELKAFAEEQTESLARIIAATVVEPMEAGFREIKGLLKISDQVNRHETDIQLLKQKLNIT